MYETDYVECDGLSIAYRATGDGPPNILMVPGIFSHVELYHECPQYSDFVSQLANFSRVIEFDKRGQGLSDRISNVPTLEERANDIAAIIHKLNLQDCVLFGLSEGAAMSLLYAATHVAQVSKVITFGGYAKSCGAGDYDLMPSYRDRAAAIENALSNWGSGSNLDIFVPSLGASDAARKIFGKIQKSSCSPIAMRKYFDLNLKIDVREILPLVQQPTLVLHHSDDRQVPVVNGEFIADRVPNARFEDCGPGGHYFWGVDNGLVINKIRSFLLEDMKVTVSSERVLATCLFLDLVGSTEEAHSHGDRQWRAVLDRHDELAGDLVELFRGRLIKLTGDGLLATFDAPGRAIECALTLRKKLLDQSLVSRAGLHSGEVEMRGGDISGLAVHVASRIEGRAAPNQILVSQTVTDLTIGNSAFQFRDAGAFALKGFEKKWNLFEVIAS